MLLPELAITVYVDGPVFLKVRCAGRGLQADFVTIMVFLKNRVVLIPTVGKDRQVFS